jgi:LuxR family maltose regulon positive regulatory protein
VIRRKKMNSNPAKSTVLRPSPFKFKPPVSGAYLVKRQRITEQIHQAHAAKLILLQAPAGFGKTTLLRELYDQSCTQGYATVWLTVDAGDNDLEQLAANISQILLAVYGSDAPLGEAGQHMLANPAKADHLATLIEAIALCGRPFLLVLDEFEQLQNPAALAIVQQLIEVLGPEQRIAIGTREYPMLSLGRLRARQQLLEIETTQLRFSLEEATEFLCEQRHLPLDQQDVERLQRATDGWVTALWLSSLALEGASDPKRFSQTFCGSSKVISSYLAEDVLSRKPPHLQEFILQTSVLGQFSAELCDAVTGRGDSRQLLEEIERANLFITTLDEQRVWFRYHPLFADFLRAHLDQQYPGLAAKLYRRAALWYLERKRPVQAIDHAIASGDQELVLRLLEQHAASLFLHGRVRLLARWFDALDRNVLFGQPKLVSVYAWVLVHSNRSAEALFLLETLRSRADAAPISHPTYLVLKTFSLAMLDRFEDTAPMWESPTILEGAASEPLLRSMLLIGCGYYYAITFRYQEARRMLDQAAQERSEVGPLFSVAVAGYIHSMVDLIEGRLHAAAARMRALLADPNMLPSSGVRKGALIGIDARSKQDSDGVDSGFACIYLAEVLYEMDELAEAKGLLKRYLPFVKETGIPDQLIASHILFARMLRLDGQHNEALQTLLDLEQLGMQRGLPRVVDTARLERARAAVLDGHLDNAKTILAQVGIAPAWQRPTLQMSASDIESPALGLWRWQIHAGHAEMALPFLKEHLKEAQRRGRVRYALRVKVLYALALCQAGQRNSALRTLRETLQEAQVEGFVRVFKDEGPMLMGLLREVVDSWNAGQGQDYLAVRQFAEAIVALPSRMGIELPPALKTEAAAPAIASPQSDGDLTTRELDVLRLLADGLGNQIIAEKLFVSVTTVRTHLRNINIKLDAHNRTEAIAIARRRAIIP